MKIAICGSMIFTEKMLEAKKELESNGHTVFVSYFIEHYVGKSEEEKVKLTLDDKNNHDAIKEFWEQINNSEAILVLNYDKRGIKNYIGGNTFLEMGFAYVLDKKIFVLNDLPEMHYLDELKAMKPIILNGDLSKIK